MDRVQLDNLKLFVDADPAGCDIWLRNDARGADVHTARVLRSAVTVPFQISAAPPRLQARIARHDSSTKRQNSSCSSDSSQRLTPVRGGKRNIYSKTAGSMGPNRRAT